MAKIRLNQLAKEFGVESKEVVDAAKDMGMDVKTHASTVSDEEADKLRAKFGANKPSAPAEEKKPAPAESKEKKPAESTESKPAAKTEGQPKPKAASEAPAAPKKKIIIVNNKPGSKPQAGGASSQPAKAYTGQNVKPSAPASPYGKPAAGGRPGTPMTGRPEPRRIIKPLTAPSDTPSVNMVQDPKNIPGARKPKTEQPEVTPAKPEAPAAEVKPAAQEAKPANTANNAPAQGQANKPQGQRDNAKGTHSISINDRPGQRSKGGYRGGNGYGQTTQSTERNDRQGGYYRQAQGGRPNNFAGPQNPQKGGFGAGAPGRGFAGGAGGQRPNGRPGAGFGNGKGAGGGKIFTSDGPTSNKGGRDARRRNEERNGKHKDINYNEEELSRSKKAGRFIKPEKKVEEVVEEQIKVITLPDSITIGDLAAKMKMKASDIIKKLFMSGKVCTVNQELSYEDAENIAMEYEILCEHEVKVNVIEELLKEDEEDTSKMKERPPVVCVMGHVDHGKTSLLDAIRKTHVTSREAG
ncbi:MAG: translation initiation factor IF-2 N-terminal domain-containing protein, partial [Lachnospiraceae bacterium]|nr:translation initiation factor IF-2 N-terminal domain-containing protein [Lachnospiraceae bacterium]